MHGKGHDMGRLLILEPFDKPVEVTDDHTISQDWHDGHAAGFAAGQAVMERQQDRLREDVVQAVLDMNFTFAEARTQVLKSLAPLLDRVVSQLLPAMSRDVTVPRIVEMMLAAAQLDSRAPMAIHVHPTVLAGLHAAWPAGAATAVTLIPDPGLSPGQALMQHNETETLLDPEGVLLRVREIFATLTAETTERPHHG
jgi:flagellar assembly protein FliH